MQRVGLESSLESYQGNEKTSKRSPIHGNPLVLISIRSLPDDQKNVRFVTTPNNLGFLD
jgi:hypothetical protein